MSQLVEAMPSNVDWTECFPCELWYTLCSALSVLTISTAKLRDDDLGGLRIGVFDINRVL